MSIGTAEASELTDVLNRVKNWSPESRIVLARRILETLEAPTRPMQGLPARSVQEPIVLGSGDSLAPDDETVKLLETTETDPVGPPPRKGSLKDMLGILKTDAPPPNDEECRAILEEELMRKYGGARS